MYLDELRRELRRRTETLQQNNEARLQALMQKAAEGDGWYGESFFIPITYDTPQPFALYDNDGLVKAVTYARSHEEAVSLLPDRLYGDWVALVEEWVPF